MLLVNSPNIEGKEIIEYCGLVTSEVLLGTNPIKDIAAGIRGLSDARNKEYEESLVKAKTLALQELEANAQNLGANAIISINLDFEVMGKSNLIMVCGMGTAVKYK